MGTEGVVVAAPGNVMYFDSGGDRIATFEIDGELLDMATSEMGPRALLLDLPDHYRLIDPTTGAVLLDERLSTGLVPSGGIALDGASAYVARDRIVRSGSSVPNTNPDRWGSRHRTARISSRR